MGMLFDDAQASTKAKGKTRTLIMQFDGGSRGNPGPAGVGVTITDEAGRPVYELGEFLGRCTNNVAEYTGLVRGLSAAIALKADKLLVRADSELVVKQVNGIYRVKSPDLKPLFQKAMDLMGQIKEVKVSHVYRESNSRADELANAAMDRQAKLEPLGPAGAGWQLNSATDK
jgi:ribonuclease HI